jgi:hypothetical protein
LAIVLRRLYDILNSRLSVGADLCRLCFIVRVASSSHFPCRDFASEQTRKRLGESRRTSFIRTCKTTKLLFKDELYVRLGPLSFINLAMNKKLPFPYARFWILLSNGVTRSWPRSVPAFFGFSKTASCKPVKATFDLQDQCQRRCFHL